MDTRTINGLSICAGIGGLDLGLRIALPSLRTVCYVEKEITACQILAERIQEGSLDDAPIWTDLATFDARAWRGVVDCVFGGFPCQPFSTASAGLRQRLEDERWIWKEVFRAICEARPILVFLENPPGILDNTGLGTVLASLASIGFAAEWDVFSACEVGAPHTRERVFILAYASGVRRFRGVVSNNGEKEAEGWASPKRSEDRPLAEMGTETTGRIRDTWWTHQPSIQRMANGIPYQMDRIAALGNAVVPLQAAYAFVSLARKAGLIGRNSQ